MDCSVSLEGNTYRIKTTTYKDIPVRVVTMAIIRAGASGPDLFPNKIYAIKILKEENQIGLLEAKTLVEAWWERNGGISLPQKENQGQGFQKIG